MIQVFYSQCRFRLSRFIRTFLLKSLILKDVPLFSSHQSSEDCRSPIRFKFLQFQNKILSWKYFLEFM